MIRRALASLFLLLPLLAFAADAPMTEQALRVHVQTTEIAEATP